MAPSTIVSFTVNATRPTFNKGLKDDCELKIVKLIVMSTKYFQLDCCTSNPVSFCVNSLESKSIKIFALDGDLFLAMHTLFMRWLLQSLSQFDCSKESFVNEATTFGVFFTFDTAPLLPILSFLNSYSDIYGKMRNVGLPSSMWYNSVFTLDNIKGCVVTLPLLLAIFPLQFTTELASMSAKGIKHDGQKPFD